MTDAPHLVSDWMTANPHTIGEDQDLVTARERMHELNVRHLPVLHGGHLVGVVSTRDIALVEALPGIDLAKVSVEEAMAEEPWTVTADARLSDVAAHMAERRLGAAIVVSAAGGDEAVGVFTTTDALRALAKLSG